MKFFSHYGNLYDIDFGFLAVYDINRNYIATPSTHFMGKNFFRKPGPKLFPSERHSKSSVPHSILRAAKLCNV
jgi:hypothetical protein